MSIVVYRGTTVYNEMILYYYDVDNYNNCSVLYVYCIHIIYYISLGLHILNAIPNYVRPAHDVFTPFISPSSTPFWNYDMVVYIPKPTIRNSSGSKIVFYNIT